MDIMADPIEKMLFSAADKMRGAMDPGEYKHVALGLLFLRYVSAAFEAKRVEFAKDEFIDLEDPEEYRMRRLRPIDLVSSVNL